MVGTSISINKEAKAVNVEQTKEEKNELSKNTMINNPFIEDTVIFAATYIEELDTIKAIWEFSDFILTDIYIRRDNSREFELFTTTHEKYIDIPVDIFSEYCDIRIVVVTEDGNKITSELVTVSRIDGTYELVKRDSDGDHLPDGYEVWDIGSDPFNSDSDGDGFSDGYEINVLFTDPIVKTKDKDSDGDGYLDSVEMLNGTNPYLPDSDFDGERDSLDTEPSITNFKSKRSVNYDVKLVIGKYDKLYEFTNADNELCTIIINTLTKNVKYYKIGDTTESYFYYDINNKMTAQINNTNGRLSADTYSYKDNRITFIGHEGVAYRFDYNDTGDLIETKVGDQVIANHEYINSSPVQTIFANGQSLSYEYSENYEHITDINVNGDLYYNNIYDSNGNIVNQSDIKNEVSYRYDYDEYGRLISAKGDNGFEIEYSSDNDDYDRFISYTYDGIVKEESLEYHDDKTVTNLINGGKILIPVSDDDTKVLFFTMTKMILFLRM